MRLTGVENLTFSFSRASRLSLPLSAVLVMLSIIQISIFGLNLGIDFRGGTLIEIRTEGPADLADLRERVSGLGLGDVQVQEFGSPDTVLLRVEGQPGGEKEQQRTLDPLRAALGDDVEYRRVEVLGPTISGELLSGGLLATALAIGAMLFYIWIRFEWQFSLGAVAALAHDVVLTAGIFSLARLEFNISIIAAGLTIIGYSMNDTVVIFDRIRENMRRYKTMEFSDLLDLSIRGTLSRTIITSVTTLIALGALLVLGGDVIFGFATAMVLGVIFGTYSSIFVAAPLLMKFGGRPGLASDDDEAPDTPQVAQASPVPQTKKKKRK